MASRIATIPKQVSGGDELVVVKKRDFEAFAKWQRAVRVRLSERWFWTPEWQKKEAEADGAIRRGKVSRPYSDHRLLLAALRRTGK